ncbi:hypothetical protein SELMODRAFT_113923 [Selaginella moellendorffii]|uniref:Pentacotripeptide-repeat region of PRORP domain-containing protein n=1 Tax=Selaginella moellendorffii TaxID=88036 RepID=D8SCJ9_SELML|nr:hypothetical protein SELMODRAFT_113923 [Selaginella moellendorffii]
MSATGVEIDDVLVATVIGICANLGDLAAGRKIHARVTTSSVIVHTALINMYGKCKEPEEAREIFDKMPDRDSGFHSDVALDNTLLNMYARCGSIAEARKLFDGMRRRSVISWSTMVAAYAHGGHHRQALDLYKAMESSSPAVKPNCITHANALSACAALGDLAEGRRIHARVVAEEWSGAAVVCSALIHMYAKCSCLDDARRVFDELRHRDLVCWNSMVAAYAQFGHLGSAVAVYREMVLDGTDPSSITLIGLVIGASHAGRVEDGRGYFVEFVDHHREVELLWEHYMCLVDLLGRCGWLQDAEELVETMPFEPCVTGWMTLLSGCRIHGDVERAERAAEMVGELEPGGEGAQSILMLGALAEKKEWDVMSLIKRHLG